MNERTAQEARAAHSQFEESVRKTAAAGGPAGEIDTAKRLLADGTITQAEFDTIKAKALAA